MPKMTSATSHTRRTFRIPDVALDHRVSTEGLKRCADFIYQQDLPVVLGNNRLHVWIKPGSTRSDALNLCRLLAYGPGVKTSSKPCLPFWPGGNG